MKNIIIIYMYNTSARNAVYVSSRSMNSQIVFIVHVCDAIDSYIWKNNSYRTHTMYIVYT